MELLDDLVITGVNYSDFGVYLCRAKSSSGIVESAPSNTHR